MDLIIIMIKLKGDYYNDLIIIIIKHGIMCVVLCNVFMNTVMENAHA
jgi:hypothetical protein